MAALNFPAIEATANKIDVQVVRSESCSDLLLPEYATFGSAGMDLRAAVESPVRLRSMERALIPTGIFLSLPVGYEAQVRPRSGLAVKYGVTVVNSPGTIDSDYTGEIKVPMINLGQEDFTIERGMRIAQMVVQKVVRANLVKVSSLKETDRGQSGFGSTGQF
jgi:dUTP pyrophosphatase